MTRETAQIIKERCNRALRELTSILEIKNDCTEEEFAAVKRGVGLSLGRIQMELLEMVNAQYSDMDDLANVTYEAS